MDLTRCNDAAVCGQRLLPRLRGRKPQFRKRTLQAESLENRCMLASMPLAEANTALFDYFDMVPPSAIGAESYVQPDSFLAFDLDRTGLETLLSSAPVESTPGDWNHSFELGIPSPTGELHHFQIVESPIMAPELAALFPDIKTYLGRGITDPAASVRFDLTPQGFHAQVLSPYGSFMIDPYYHLDQSVYASYWRGEFGMDPVSEQLRFETVAAIENDMDHDDHDHDDDGEFPFLERTGETLRTYRLAVAATGEYTVFHGGTVAAGQAAIVTAMNRVTQIYELELTVRMVLVPNNNLLVFTNPQTDPYTNNNGVTMLGQNQTTLDNIIGNANYDIGHVFSTGGGGVAGLGVIGVTGQKARGVTGLPSPIGDPFYVDYVAHEMGHQYGANHTFNGTGGSCAGNRSANSAYEPGSGSTIMAYAGICGSDNLQTFSDPYMHSRSLDEILNRLGQIPNVGTHTPTGNNAPIAVAGQNYTIPARTPFRLFGSGSDPNAGNVLTFTWEQRDLGPALSLAQPDNGSSPLVRSWLATTNPVRTVPRLSNLLNNTLPVGERLPQVNRTMRFRLTVRDNVAGAGGVNTSDLQYSVIDTGAGFAITSPNTTNITWNGNSTQTITWNVAGTDTGSINTPNVNILLSTDGGQTYPTTLAANVPNDGSHDIIVPNVDTLTARVLIEGAGNVFFDIANFNLRIMPTTLPGDFNGDSLLDCADINALTTAIATGSTNLLYDVTGDGLVNHNDLNEWILNLKQTLFGDANLDFSVDGSDFSLWNSSKFTVNSNWCEGDFNADGVVDGSDFNVWNQNKFTNAMRIPTDPTIAARSDGTWSENPASVARWADTPMTNDGARVSNLAAPAPAIRWNAEKRVTETSRTEANRGREGDEDERWDAVFATWE